MDGQECTTEGPKAGALGEDTMPLFTRELNELADRIGAKRSDVLAAHFRADQWDADERAHECRRRGLRERRQRPDGEHFRGFEWRHQHHGRHRLRHG